MTISITAAIAAATDKAHIVKVSRGSYEVRTLDEKINMYRASPAMSYEKARSRMTEVRHALALKALGWDNMDALCEADSHNAAGSLRDRVKRSVSRA